MFNKKEGALDTKIREARQHLRDLHSKYVKELYDIALKIDNFLEEIEVSYDEIPNN